MLRRLRQPKSREEIGKIGENAAARHLQSQGYAILERNWTCAAGEIDIVARHRDTLVFVEVKTRTSDEFAAPAESVTAHKRRHLIACAKMFLAARAKGECPCRFDIVEVLLTPRGRIIQIDLLLGAFGVD
jgi:putative endonuclease